MFKYLVVLALCLAMAIAAPQVLLGAGLINNEVAKQVGLPYANGWTDGPNNGVGPVVSYAAVPRVIAGVPSVYSAGISSVYAAGVPRVIAGVPSVYSAGYPSVYGGLVY